MRFGWAAAIIYEECGERHSHIVPVNDLREHELHNECWCRPDEDDDDLGIWVHHALDNREDYEMDRMRH
jgi:hypothetical protein